MHNILRASTLAAMLACPAVSNATLIDRGNGMIYDSFQNLTWLQDANHAKTSGYDSDGLMGWNEAVAWANNLTYGGYDDWRLPQLDIISTGFGFSLIFSEILLGPATNLSTGICFQPTVPNNSNQGIGCVPGNPLFTNIDSVPFWYGNEDGNSAWASDVGGFLYPIALYPKSESFHTWAVRDGDVTAVPEPGTLLLLALGLACMAGILHLKMQAMPA